MRIVSRAEWEHQHKQKRGLKDEASGVGLTLVATHPAAAAPLAMRAIENHCIGLGGTSERLTLFVVVEQQADAT
jgi:hypothetical protein